MIEEEDTDERLEDKPDDNDDEFIFYTETEEIDFAKLCAGDISPELKEIIDDLDKDPELETQLMELLSNLDLSSEEGITKEKSKLIRLIQIYLSRMKNIDHHNLNKLLRKRDRAITEHLAALSHYLIFQKANESQVVEKKGFFKKLEEKLFGSMSQSMKNLKDAIKRFVVYEIYEIQNPKRIAGESKIKNFVHNMILGGFKRASKYEGGRASDIKHYRREFIESLERQHRRLALQGKVPSDGLIAPETPGGVKPKPKSQELGI